MEKLLQLLNEFYPVDGRDKEYHIEDSMVYVRDYDDDDIFNYEIFTLNVISKRFGFIQWLVEHDKIILQKVIRRVEYCNYGVIEDIHYYSAYQSILMYLAIQDNPISFLVSILK